MKSKCLARPPPILCIEIEVGDNACLFSGSWLCLWRDHIRVAQICDLKSLSLCRQDSFFLQMQMSLSIKLDIDISVQFGRKQIQIKYEI